MIGTESFFTHRQRPLVQRLGFGIVTLRVINRGQVVQRYRNIWMIGTERFFSYCQRPLEQRFGVCIATLVLVKLTRLFSDVATSGWSGPKAFSSIANDRLYSGSASA